jgi:hypothetical protein
MRLMRMIEDGRSRLDEQRIHAPQALRNCRAVVQQVLQNVDTIFVAFEVVLAQRPHDLQRSQTNT